MYTSTVHVPCIHRSQCRVEQAGHCGGEVGAEGGEEARPHSALEKRAAIEEMCNEIEALMQELAELQARGEVRRGRGEGGSEEMGGGGRER